MCATRSRNLLDVQQRISEKDVPMVDITVEGFQGRGALSSPTFSEGAR